MTHAHATLPGLFEHFRDAKRRKLPGWAIPLFAGCSLFTAMLMFAMWARSIWNTEQLERPKHSIDLAIAPAPPPPPPPLAGGEKPVVVPNNPKHTVRELVQLRIEKPDPRPVDTEVGDPNGQKDGVKDGTGDNPDGVVTDIPTPPQPPVQIAPPPVKPTAVPSIALEAQRIAGEKLIVPDDVTKIEIQRSGKNALTGTFKFCLDATGAVRDVQTYRSTGFPAYDNKIISTIRGDWRYRPFAVNGQPTPVCTAVTFRYSQ